MDELARCRDQFPILKTTHFYTCDDELGALMHEIRAIRESRAYQAYLTSKDTVT